MKVSANISTKLRQNSEFHALYGWASQAVACGSVEDFSSTSQLLLLYTSTSATAPAAAHSPASPLLPLPRLRFMPKSKQQVHADSYSLYFQYLVGFFSLFKEASYISMWTTAVQHYQVFPQSRYFGLGQVVVLHIADNNDNKSLQSRNLLKTEKANTAM